MNDASYAGEQAAAPDNQRTRKRHRLRHSKSRLGCFPCKSRRVKCDEARPVCGSCSSRGEPCSFPDSAIFHRPTTSSRTQQGLPRSRSGGSTPGAQSYLEPLRIHTALSVGASTLVNDNILPMDDLLSMQFFHLHTAYEMCLHPKRSMVWRRVVPDLAGRHCYLMHLLLALGGIHMITGRSRQRYGGKDDNSETVDLRGVIDHHQRGLRDFREQVVTISNSNAEAVYAGSLLLVAFSYASLQVPELNPPATTVSSVHYVSASNKDTTPTLNRPNLNWIHLIRGVVTVVGDQWPALKASRMRPMVLHFHGDEYWKDLPFASSLSRLSRCSSRLLLFAESASQAVTELRTAYAAVQLADVNESSTSVSPSTSEWTMDEQPRAIDVLEMLYSRIISVLQCSFSECGSPDNSDIQAGFEEATVLSWPSLIPHEFISFIELNDQRDPVWGLSLTTLAHFYVVNTLVDRWFLASFKDEIFRIHRSVSNLCNAHLDRLMLWPVKIATCIQN
ncbi:uncharacterized protein TRUGW13939_11100 [Talaromyces rugulosus]|uniref:Zn(2)-C6 fungal-type domain-containing protein n=1 Tax=Talaromyces rugulosus TaxID=121627 RepID=A0A7H8RD60_TALRU|nr:uncharacterized protein TRUGW13939_11100 [Talaromyces rugulosus]QKX63928.1 hypothetical protein TRUGW13939_11100 [Talaromyces rugulosus]